MKSEFTDVPEEERAAKKEAATTEVKRSHMSEIVNEGKGSVIREAISQGEKGAVEILIEHGATVSESGKAFDVVAQMVPESEGSV